MAIKEEKIDVVRQVSNIGDVPQILDSEDIDVLIIGMQENTPQQFCRDMLKKYPGLLIVGLVDDGRTVVACLADVGIRQLVKMILEVGL